MSLNPPSGVGEPSDALLELLARRLRALADPTRIRLLARLEREPATVRELTDELATSGRPKADDHPTGRKLRWEIVAGRSRGQR